MNKSSYTNLKPGGGMPPTRFQVCLGRVPYVVAALITVVAAWVVIAWLNEEDLLYEYGEFPYGTLTDLTQPIAFKRAYIKANGGLELLKVLQSVRMSGRMESGGSSQRFYSMKKYPDRMLLTFDMETHELTLAADGDEVWQRLRVVGQDDQVAVLEGPQATAVLGMRDFFGPMMSLFFLEDGELGGIKVASYEGQPCLQVDFNAAGSGRAMEAFVDPRTMNTIVRYERFADGKVRKTIYGDYRSLKGMQEPFLTESYIDDLLESRVIIEVGEANLGVVPWMFEVPKAWKSGNLED